MSQTLVSVASQIRRAGAERADEPALIAFDASGAESTLTWGQLDRESERLAHVLADQRLNPTQVLALNLPAGLDLIKFVVAAWKLGSTLLVLNSASPRSERAALLGAAGEFRPVRVIGGADDELPAADLIEAAAEASMTPIEDRVPQPSHLIGSGGTSGLPKIVVTQASGQISLEDGKVVLPADARALGFRAGQRRLVCTPFYHTNSMSVLTLCLLSADSLLLFEKFDAEAVLNAIAHHGVQQFLTVPSVLQRMAATEAFKSSDLPSLEAVSTGGSHCPDWLARKWIERVGPEHFYYGYGATESIGKAMIRGDEYLKHPGSVGRPVATEVRILSESGDRLPAGQIGLVYMRPEGATKVSFKYLGDQYAGVTDDGFATVGDFGRVDEDGYLYIVDRRSDLIVTGGANVYPAEVEAVLSGHPEVADAAVIGLPDEQWGHRVHAVIEARDPGQPPPIEELSRYCREHLASLRCPKTWEFVDEMPRTEAGKVSRRRLIDERVAGLSG